MHRLATIPGGWTPETEGLITVEQSPAPIVFLTAADSEIQTLALAQSRLPEGFPCLRAVNLLQLQQQLTIDTYAEAVLSQAQLIILRLLGGRAYWPYGLEVVKEVAAATQAALIVLPGDDRPAPDLISHSTVPLGVANQLWRYLNEGGVDNLAHGLVWVWDRLFQTNYQPPPPQPIPRVGLYAWSQTRTTVDPAIGILFYRAHYLAGNTAPIDSLCSALSQRGYQPLPIYLSSLQEIEVQQELQQLLQTQQGIEVLLNTTSFALAKLGGLGPDLTLWQTLDVPVLQVILSGDSEATWRDRSLGLSPRDIAMNVALPEVDGRIITRAVSFKAASQRHAALETEVVTYQPVPDRIDFVADLAVAWADLRQTPASDRRLALVLANYPNRDGRLANGVGLDTPQSAVEILQALQRAGYSLDQLPQDGNQLIQWLTAGVTPDLDGMGPRLVRQSLSLSHYQEYFQALPDQVKMPILNRWGDPAIALGEAGAFTIPGLQCGRVFLAIQPSRGYDLDPSLNYHCPDLEPPHSYLAVYLWLRHQFGAQAMVHLGKHGNLEWLPGKGVGLSCNCYPEVVLGPLPHLYPFIVNDPGEGAQAKRRAQAVILDHLTPPLTRAELYGPLQTLEGLVDEYYEAQSLDPSRLSAIGDRLLALLTTTHVLADLPQPTPRSDLAPLLPRLDTYLCELKEAQIRDGLHIFGRCPQGQRLRDLIIAIARHPGPGRQGLTRAIALAWGLDFDPLTVDPATPWIEIEQQKLPHCRIAGDGVEALEQEAASLIERILADPQGYTPPTDSTLAIELVWIQNTLLPALIQTQDEITHLLHSLGGGYVPSGPAGAPTRNRPEVLPTGRNFFSVDIRAIPTETAWDVGRRAAAALIDRYTQDHGEYPQTLGLSVWGTATMRTGGDDIAQALALIGVRPVWDGPSRRVVDFEILPLSALGRPRVDVTLRISGFFRDAFPNLIDLFDQAVGAVAALPEGADQNPLAHRVAQETLSWQQQGLTPDQARRRSSYRIFGSKPGAYGAGLQGLIESQNWTTDADLARAYLNWSGYGYGQGGEGAAAAEAFEQRLHHLQVILHNQDNREHDLLDSDDYYQFQGGMSVASRTLQGRQVPTYFGDNALIDRPRVRLLQEEISRVYRSRVVNPKWIKGVMDHGYKGAFEMAATVDYLFAYDATTHCVADYMYEGIAQAYLIDPTVQRFIQQSNPWALRDMAERLLEAHQRGLWATPNLTLLESLRQIAHRAEAWLETQADNLGG